MSTSPTNTNEVDGQGSPGSHTSSMDGSMLLSSTPLSSLPSDISENEEHKHNENTAQLPGPFFPPSLAKGTAGTSSEDSFVPRPLPSHLNLPGVPNSVQSSEIDSPDIGTPDAWIPRDPRLVRLTGKHPLNSEARLRDLYAAGFITPSSLFFVRNHGAVPRISQEVGENWEMKVHGLCNNPTTFSIDDLRQKFRVVTVPITIVCAGNRRKEQNIVQQSLGFSWGAGGVSTALFTGVYLADVVAHVQPGKGAKHVIFEGADDLPNGPYGTSQLLSWASDKKKGMVIAWAMNGLALEPDHGYPLRLVVPSQVGGRSVKWLSRIELSAVESQHHLHFHDNKVLPMPVGPEQARKEKEWWYDPRYIIYNISVNSVIAQPDHGETLNPSTPTAMYSVKGYAYAGSGRRVSRVELSLDNGDTWELACISYPEDAFRKVRYDADEVYGELDMTESDACFCWCFWSYEVPVRRLFDLVDGGPGSIIVRAMDDGMAVQPRDMYWNALGMMNNWWFRVMVHRLEDGNIMFEHPTMAGTQPGGWMQRLKDEGLDPSKPDFTQALSTPTTTLNKTGAATKQPEKKILMTNPSVSRKISVSELEAKEARDEAWFAVRGEVYNGSGYLKDHPGGAASIKLVAGEDATEDFIAIHSVDARKQLAEFHIGTLVRENGGQSLPASVAGAGSSEGGLGEGKGKGEGGGEGRGGDSEADVDVDIDEPFLNAKKWSSAKLTEIRDVSKNSKVFRFALNSPKQEPGLAFGQHLYVRLRLKRKKTKKFSWGAATTSQGVGLGFELGDDDEMDMDMVQRAYTPLLDRDSKGFVDLLVKIYYPNETYPQGGTISAAFAALAIGDRIEMKGPVGDFIWKGRGVAALDGGEIERRVREVGLVCGGTGVTPILQVLRAILSDPSSSSSCLDEDTMTKVWVLDANRSVDDILCKDEIDSLARENEGVVNVHYTLTGTDEDVPEDWKYSRGRITPEMLRMHLPVPNPRGGGGGEKMVCVCGPHDMEQAVKGFLLAMGWDESQVVLF